MRDRIVSAKRAGREEEASKAEIVGFVQPRAGAGAGAGGTTHETTKKGELSATSRSGDR